MSDRDRGNGRATGAKALFLGALACALAALAYSALAQDFSAYPERLAFAFPGLIALAMALVALLLLATAPADQEAELDAAPAAGKWRAALAGLAALIFYVAAVDILGFIPASIVFQSLAFAAVFGKRGVVWLAVAPCVMTGVFSVLFAHALGVSLPRGVGLFYAINAALI